MSLLLIASLLLLGSVAGFAAGLLGIGGGMMMVPFLVIILQAQQVAGPMLVKAAIATSLATILFTSISSIRAHHLAGAIRWPIVATLAPGIVIGALLGARIAGWANPQYLEVAFGLFVSYSATQMMRSRKAPAAGQAPVERHLPGRIGMVAMGTLIGVLSALMGAGGAFLTVPFLTSHGERIQNAIACSAACGLPVAIAGAVGYLWAGYGLDLGPGMLGFLYLPGLLCIASASVLTAPLGARTAHRMSVMKLRRVFACLLYALAGYMWYRAFTQHGSS